MNILSSRDEKVHATFGSWRHATNVVLRFSAADGCEGDWPAIQRLRLTPDPHQSLSEHGLGISLPSAPELTGGDWY